MRFLLPSVLVLLVTMSGGCAQVEHREAYTPKFVKSDKCDLQLQGVMGLPASPMRDEMFRRIMQKHTEGSCGFTNTESMIYTGTFDIYQKPSWHRFDSFLNMSDTWKTGENRFLASVIMLFSDSPIAPNGLVYDGAKIYFVVDCDTSAVSEPNEFYYKQVNGNPIQVDKDDKQEHLVRMLNLTHDGMVSNVWSTICRNVEVKGRLTYPRKVNKQ